MTPKELFERMPSAFVPENAARLDATIQFDLSGDNGGQWLVKIADGQCEVTEGTGDSPTMTLSMEANDYLDLVAGRLNPMNAFMQGKIKLKGDMGLAMKFQKMFKTGAG